MRHRLAGQEVELEAEHVDEVPCCSRDVSDLEYGLHAVQLMKRRDLRGQLDCSRGAGLSDHGYPTMELNVPTD
jgi:hypothetical protein